MLENGKFKIHYKCIFFGMIISIFTHLHCVAQTALLVKVVMWYLMWSTTWISTYCVNTINNYESMLTPHLLYLLVVLYTRLAQGVEWHKVTRKCWLANAPPPRAHHWSFRLTTRSHRKGTARERLTGTMVQCACATLNQLRTRPCRLCWWQSCVFFSRVIAISHGN